MLQTLRTSLAGTPVWAAAVMQDSHRHCRDRSLAMSVPCFRFSAFSSPAHRSRGKTTPHDQNAEAADFAQPGARQQAGRGHANLPAQQLPSPEGVGWQPSG